MSQEPDPPKHELKGFNHLESAPLIDTHCHLDDEAFDTELDDILNQARQRGVRGFIIPGVIASNWPRILDLATGNPDIHAVLGLHPCFVDKHSAEDLNVLEDLLGNQTIKASHIVGIGECGLDFFIKEPDRQKQLYYFEAQLGIAKKTDLPIVIHARKSVEEVIQSIRRTGHHRGVVHSYSGSLVQANRLIELGYYFSFGGAITYTRASKLRKLVAQLPLDTLLLETDAPFQPDSDCVNSRNDPGRLPRIFETVCELRSESREEIAEQTTQNAVRLFNIEGMATEGTQ